LIFGIVEDIEVEKQHFFFTFSPPFGAKLEHEVTRSQQLLTPCVVTVTDRGHHR
jgi:hypothetical protein